MPENELNLTEFTLASQREIIDEIDTQLVELLNKRAGASLAIAAIKHTSGLPIYLKSREDEVLKRICELNGGPYTNPQVTNIFQVIMEESRQIQANYIQGQSPIED